MWVPLSCSRDLDRGLVRLVLDATLWAIPCTDAAYEARDIRSDAAANDCLDWRSSERKKSGRSTLVSSLWSGFYESSGRGFTWSWINQIRGKCRPEVTPVWMVGETVLWLSICNGACFADFGISSEGGKVRDVTPQIVRYTWIFQWIDAWSRYWTTTVSWYLIPILAVKVNEKKMVYE